MKQWISDNDAIRRINTREPKLSESEIQKVFENGLIMAFKESSDTCYTKLLLNLNKALKEALRKPIIK